MPIKVTKGKPTPEQIEKFKDVLHKALYGDRQFCRFCGAGLGKYRRDGEGTCPNCEEQ